MINMYLYNKSSVVSDGQCQLMIQACNSLLPAFCSAWAITVPTFTFLAKNVKPPTSVNKPWIFYMIDESPVQDALAYHTEERDVVDGYIAAKTCIDNGCVPIYKDDKTDTVAAALSHEIFEALVDRFCNTYWDDTRAFFWSAEVCDPVQENLIVVHIGNQNVALSNFILPSWTDPELVTGKVDYAGILTKPFTLASGGYAVKLAYGDVNPQTVFGQNVPSWKRSKKDKKHTRLGCRQDRKATIPHSDGVDRTNRHDI